MDVATIKIYDLQASDIASLHSALVPARIYELVSSYFVKGGLTADIGCGIGRDTNWLNQQGFQAIGIDASGQMLREARRLYPSGQFFLDSLPALNSLKGQKFQNILCSAVIMHLKHGELLPACQRLLELMDDNGRILLSFRGTHFKNHIENGKLYLPIDVPELLEILAANGGNILIQESTPQPSRNLLWHNIVARKICLST